MEAKTVTPDLYGECYRTQAGMPVAFASPLASVAAIGFVGCRVSG
jgi:hypothetical protein